MTEDPSPRVRLGPYRLVRFLREDVAGQLYVARHVDRPGEVIVKVFAPSVCQNPAFGRYFYHKCADRQALIEHPNVLQVIDVGQESGASYVVVEDAGGEQLSQKLSEAPLETEEALNIVRQIAEGLRAGHRRDIVHGHVKPSDVILTRDKLGRPLVKVCFFDLGLGATESVVSIFGEAVGAPKYMAPEVIKGRLPGPQADVFALGVLAYELLTGQEPFPSDHAVGYLFSNCESDPTAPGHARADLAHEIALVVMRMLEKEPARRYRSMQRVIDDLDRCAQSMQTGHVEAVPYGSDSAFARTYELPAQRAEAAKGRPRPARQIVGVAALVVLVGLLGYWFGGGFPGFRAEGTPIERAAAPPPRPGPVAPPGSARLRAVAPPQVAGPAGEAPAPPEGEEPARDAFELASRDWERFSRRNDFELGIEAFRAVARQHPDTPYARRAREQIARIHTEWARSEADVANLEAAVSHYEEALAAAPEASSAADLARRSLPGALAALAESVRLKGQYERAIDIYEQIAERFPGTKEAALLESRKPQIMLEQAFMLWHDAERYDEALSRLLEVVRDYGGTEWGENARQAVPDLYLDAVREKLSAARYGEARAQLVELVEAYPAHKAAGKAAELDAQILFRLFQAEREAGAQGSGEEHYGELLQRYRASAWTVRAARVVLGLERPAGDVFDSTTARSQLKDAREAYGRLEFPAALTALKGVLRYARAESPEAAEALATLPQWLYESAMHIYGQGMRGEWRPALAELSAQFPGTEYARRAGRVTDMVDDPPEGMVYVAAGPFWMGTGEDEIISLLRKHGPNALGGGREEVLLFAEVAGLLSETPRHVERTDAFFIDRTEVTNAEYKEFVDATGTPPPAGWPGGTYPEGAGQRPVVNVSLSEAAAYAKWRGCRLPTEAEWEKAARGTDGRRFPWGELFDQKGAHHMRSEAAGTVAVGSFPTWDSPYGCLDVIGNVREWTTTPSAAYAGSRWQGAAEVAGTVVARGGAWFQEELVPIPARCASRYPVDPAAPDQATGFRCVRDVPEAGPAGGP